MVWVSSLFFTEANLCTSIYINSGKFCLQDSNDSLQYVVHNFYCYIYITMPSGAHEWSIKYLVYIHVTAYMCLRCLYTQRANVGFWAQNIFYHCIQFARFNLNFFRYSRHPQGAFKNFLSYGHFLTPSIRWIKNS